MVQDVALAYDRGFARRCAGAIDGILGALASHGRHGAQGAQGARGAQGVRMLDIGAGTGRLAAAAAGAGFAVTAVEPDARMLELGRRRTSPGPVTWLAAEAPELRGVPAGFDAVVASFVVNHVPDPRTVVRALHDRARPDGLVATTIWGSGPGPFVDLCDQVVAESGAERHPTPRLPPHLDFPRTADGLAQLHEEALAELVLVTELGWTARIDPAELWASIEAGLYGIGTLYRRNAPAGRRAMLETYRRITRGMLAEDGLLHLEETAPFVLARSREVRGASA